MEHIIDLVDRTEIASDPKPFAARIVRMRIPPDHVVGATRTLSEVLAARCREAPGYEGGCSLVDGESGRAIQFTLWSDEAAMRADATAEGVLREHVGHAYGIATVAVEYALLVGHHRTNDRSTVDGSTFSRLTWVSGLKPNSQMAAARLHRMFGPEYRNSPGFVGSYWCIAPATGNGWSLSLWDTPLDRARSSRDGARRLHVFRHAIPTRRSGVEGYEVAHLDVPGRVVDNAPAVVELRALQAVS